MKIPKLISSSTSCLPQRSGFGNLAWLILVPVMILAWSATFLVALPTPPPGGRVILSRQYPTNELDTNALFRIYHSTNIDLPLMYWMVLTNLVATNTSITLQTVPGPNFFVVTISNFWGESGFSNVASTPALPRSDVNLNIKRGD